MDYQMYAIDVVRSVVNRWLKALEIETLPHNDDEFYDWSSVRVDEDEGRVFGSFRLGYTYIQIQVYMEWGGPNRVLIRNFAVILKDKQCNLGMHITRRKSHSGVWITKPRRALTIAQRMEFKELIGPTTLPIGP